jgi:hypothetical protein
MHLCTQAPRYGKVCESADGVNHSTLRKKEISFTLCPLNPRRNSWMDPKTAMDGKKFQSLMGIKIPVVQLMLS